jgi:hypothetical protein
MNTIKNNKNFNCIAYKRKIQTEIYETIKDLSVEEQIIYFRKKAQASQIGEWWKSIKTSTHETAPVSVS